MLSMRKRLIIIGAMVVAVIAIITAVFACSNKWDNGYSFSNKDKNKPNAGTCTVIFDACGGWINSEPFFEFKVNKDSMLERPTEEPVRDGYIFWGWNLTGNIADPMWKFHTAKVSEDTMLRAVWVQAVTVTFNADGGTFEDGTDRLTVTVAQGDKINAPAVTPPDANMELQSWTYYTDTWNTDTWNMYDDAVYSDVTLYANWDLKRDIKRALAPFKYSIKNDGYCINGVVDTNVSGTLTVPSIVTSIEYMAFANCGNIVSVIIPDSVTEIAHYAFQNCKSLKSVTLPSDLQRIASHTFGGCSSLEQIRLPDTITEIGEYAFYGCSSLKSIEIPSGVTEIENDTFWGCSSLRQVKLGEGVTAIGDYAFDGCSSLTSFDIPVGVEQLGIYAFSSCAALKSITVPVTCKAIGRYSFAYCTGLVSAELHCETVNPYAFSGCIALADVTLGDEVLTIGNVFNECSDLRSVTIGDGLKAIPNSAFAYCYNLRNVNIGGGVKEINNYAFLYCYSLLSITIPSNVEVIGWNVFTGCNKLVEVYNLSDVSLLNSTNIGAYVIVHTDADEESIIHTTDDGFSFCMFRDENVFPYDQTPFLMDYSGSDEDIVLPDSYNGDSYKLYKYALSHNSRLRSVKFSAGVMGINEKILYKSDNVTSLTVDGDNEWLSSADNCVISTAEKKFILGCMTSVIPTDGSVTTIGDYVFCDNSIIMSGTFKIPDTVTRVYRNAFSGCNGIMRTVNHIVYVDKWAISLGFFDLNSDEKLDLEFQSGTIGIAEYAFWKDNCIRSVTFNDEMRYVGMDAFSNCGELTTVNFNDGLVVIGGSAFYDCDKLQEAVIPDSVTTIGWGAFAYSDALVYVKIPAALASANTQIFYKCSALDAIVIPQSIEVIDYSMFSSCPDTVNVYYCGSEEQWKAVIIRNDNAALLNGTKYYYSETEIEGVNCWHYGADGKPTTTY